MKKLFNYSIALLIGSMAIFSCRQRDVVAPTVVQQSNTPNGTHSYTFAVLVIPAATQGFKVEGISGAKVTISQGTNIQTATTGADGIANFSGLNEGNVDYSINVGTTGGINYANVSGTQALSLSTSNFSNGNQSNQTGGVSVIIPIAQKTASISGKLVGDFDFLSSTPVSGQAGIDVRLQYAYTTGYVLEPNYYITQTDADGNFTFANVPSVDNLPSGVSATITAESSSASGTGTVTFKLAALPTTLSSGKSTNIGTKILVATGIYTSTVTGVLYGDFPFVTATTNGGGTATDVSPQLLGPAVSSLEYTRLVTAAGFALATYPGFNAGFIKSGIVLHLTYPNLPAGQVNDFVATTDATGRFTFANVPNSSSGGVTLTASVQVPRVNVNNGLLEQKTFALGGGSGLGVTVSSDQVQDFGSKVLDLLP